MFVYRHKVQGNPSVGGPDSYVVTNNTAKLFESNVPISYVKVTATADADYSVEVL